MKVPTIKRNRNSWNSYAVRDWSIGLSSFCHKTQDSRIVFLSIHFTCRHSPTRYARNVVTAATSNPKAEDRNERLFTHILENGLYITECLRAKTFTQTSKTITSLTLTRTDIPVKRLSFLLGTSLFTPATLLAYPSRPAAHDGAKKAVKSFFKNFTGSQHC